MDAERQTTVTHAIPPVWNAESRVLVLGTMPSPASRKAGFFYMHPQNRFWRVLPALFGEMLTLPNNARDRDAAIAERRAFLLAHRIALWDVLSRCDITGASDASIANAEPNDFMPLFTGARISHVFCTGKAAAALWNRFCAAEYEPRFGITATCLPSTSPANAAWSLEKLIAAYRPIAAAVQHGAGCREP